MALSVYLSNSSVFAVTGAGSGITNMLTVPLISESFINGVIIDKGSFVGEISAIWEKYALPRKNVKLTVSGSQFISKNISIRSKNKRQLESLARNEFLPIDSLMSPLIVSKIYDEHGGQLYSVATAADEKYIRELADCFTKAGIAVTVITTPLFSAMNFIDALPELTGKTFIMNITDGDYLLIILMHKGKYYYSTGGRIFNEPGTDEYINEITAQTMNALSFHSSERLPEPVGTVYLCGYSADNFTRLSDSIRALSGISCESADSSRAVRLSGDAYEKKLGDYVYAVGEFLSK